MRSTAALAVALTLFATGCAALDETSTNGPAGSVIAKSPSGSLDGATDSTADALELEHVGEDENEGKAEAEAEGIAPEEPGVGSALELLATIAVKGRAPKTGYDRKAQFGSPWLDVDRNGCDTRNDILQRDLSNLSLAGPCKVLSGTLADKYTGQTINFVRGNKTSTLVQIDHVVALSDSWQKGAQGLSSEARVALANDPLNLFAADGPANSAKSDGDAATWLPKNRGFRCEYVARQISVKAAYGLWVTASEQAAMQRVLADCPAQPAVASTLASKFVTPKDPDPAQPEPAAPGPVEPRPVAPAPPTPPAPAPAPSEPAPPAADVYFQNCAAARQAGAAPVYAGQPGYGRHLDRDGDGAGCE